MTIRMQRPSPLGIAGTAVGVALMAALGAADVTGLRINGTASMPRGLWRMAPVAAPLQRGAIVVICPPDTAPFRAAAARGYIPAGTCPGGTEPLVKPVGAIAGDTVAVSASGLVVNGLIVQDTAPLAADSAGRPLQPVHAGTYTVGTGEIWLLSGHDPRSFDSRYFGPLPAENVQGLARPIWVLP